MKQWICVLCCMALLCAMVGCASGLPLSESEIGIDKDHSQNLGMDESSEYLLVDESLECSSSNGGLSSVRLDGQREKRLGFVEVKRFVNGKGLQALSREEVQEFEGYLESVGSRDFFQETKDVFSGADSFCDSLLKDGYYVVELSELDFNSLQEAAKLRNWYLRLATLS